MSFEPKADSFEKVRRGQAGTQIAAWDETNTWFGPLREYAKVSAHVRALLPSGTIAVLTPSPLFDQASTSTRQAPEKRLMFLQWEIETLVLKQREQFSSSFALLKKIFFEDISFEINPKFAITGASALLETTLARRQGPLSLSCMLFAWMGEVVANVYGDASDFRRIELVSSAPTEVVRVLPKPDLGAVCFVDLSRQGERVDESSWAEWCADGLARISWKQGLIRSLIDLFRSLERSSYGDDPADLETLTAQVYVLDEIISLQPSETGRWAERAILNTRRGDRGGALDDLKRFFAFHERETAPAAIVSLFDELKKNNELPRSLV
ncbi:MAG: hypothetical protein RBT63_10045 [Bdellovibrionales bacterium]|jgi:hypothetical protein|nr:hypothetical protein [Bdellovibrionales bacterium]